ncbi:SOS response-associated peptidase [Chlorobaculum limnaeum]|nr:SOS response-associated peptidase [Chlorobaculum limnaeum]
MLEPQHGKQWIEAGSPDTAKLLLPIGDGKLHIYPVSTQVNNPRYVRRDCIEEIETDS